MMRVPLEDGTVGQRSVSVPEFEIAETRGVMVPMRDGVELATDIFLPARDGVAMSGPFPTVFHRTPYDKTAVENRWRYHEWFTRRGYASVMQDVRGTFASQGGFEFLAGEAEDGADALAWIDQQEWSDGKVGSWGTSYASFTQLAMATQGPPNLRAMVPNQSASNAWAHSIRQGGAFELRFLGWALWHSATNTRADLREEMWRSSALNFGSPRTSDWLTRLPIRRGDTQLKLVPEYEDWLLKAVAESDFTEYWKQPSLAPVLYADAFPGACDILLLGAWYDSYPRATFELFNSLSEKTDGLVRVLIGPWIHGTAAPESRISGNLDMGPHAAIPDLRELHLRWFDHSLKGLDTGVADETPVRIFVMGGGSGQRTVSGHLAHEGAWRDESHWPLERAESTNYYLHGDLSISPNPPQGESSSTTYRFDPNNPVPSIGGSVSSLADLRDMPKYHTDTDTSGGSVRYQNVMEPGGFDQVEGPLFHGCTPPYLPLCSRNDIVVFRSPPLAEDVEITGPVEVVLWVSTNAPDTDFTAKLVDEYPPSKWFPLGYALNISDSVIRLRYAQGDTAQLMTPGDVVEIVVVLYPTSNVFAAGHRLRLDVSSSNFPRFDVNPNTGDPLGTERRKLAADNTVYHDAARPSRIRLPVVRPATAD